MIRYMKMKRSTKKGGPRLEYTSIPAARRCFRLRVEAQARHAAQRITQSRGQEKTLNVRARIASGTIGLQDEPKKETARRNVEGVRHITYRASVRCG